MDFFKSLIANLIKKLHNHTVASVHRLVIATSLIDQNSFSYLESEFA